MNPRAQPLDDADFEERGQICDAVRRYKDILKCFVGRRRSRNVLGRGWNVVWKRGFGDVVFDGDVKGGGLAIAKTYAKDDSLGAESVDFEEVFQRGL